MTYKKAPIVEAVVEIRFASAASPDFLDKVRRKFSKRYPHSEQIVEIEVMVTSSNLTSPTLKNTAGFKLTNSDATEISLLKPNSIATCRLAPYTGWEELYERVRWEHEVWQSVTGAPSKITRIGVRFINRLDIPIPRDETQRVRFEDYLQIYVSTPDPDTKMNVYALQIQTPVPERENWVMTVNSALVPPALIDHFSLLLDLDLGILSPPQSHKQVMDVLEEVRSVKNSFFEEYITEKARELFRQ